MGVVEAIIKDLNHLSATKLVEVAAYVHEMNSDRHAERLEILKKTRGALSDEDGKSFEKAMNASRQLEAK